MCPCEWHYYIPRNGVRDPGSSSIPSHLLQCLYCLELPCLAHLASSYPHTPPLAAMGLQLCWPSLGSPSLLSLVCCALLSSPILLPSIPFASLLHVLFFASHIASLGKSITTDFLDQLNSSFYMFFILSLKHQA